MSKSSIEKAMTAITKSREASHLMGNKTYVLDVPECKTQLYLNRENQRAFNVELVRGYLETHLGATSKEVAMGLSLSYDCANRAVNALRAEWQGKR